MRVLDDLRVIELSETAAAAFAGRLCADAGAEVVLVEPPDGHPLRREGPFVGPANERVSAVHLHVNAGKRSVVLDTEAQAGELRTLVEGADVFITDWRTSALKPLGLDAKALRARAPALVITQVTPFGDNGPYRDYAGTNLVELALGGQLKITGDPDRPPLSNYGSQAEYQAGLSAFAGTVSNVLLRDASGEGETLDLGILDVVATNSEHRGPALNLGAVANRAGLSVSATYGVYPCADGFVYLTAFAPPLWERLKAAVRLDELEDERFSTQASRLEHNDELQAVLTGWTLGKTSDELRVFARKGDPMTVMETPDRLLASEQWRGRGVAHEMDLPDGAVISVLGPPWLHEQAPNLAPELAEASSDFLGRGPERLRRGELEAPRKGGPLAGMRVVDWTIYWAGPFLGLMLHDLGAEVIKIESPSNWDAMRTVIDVNRYAGDKARPLTPQERANINQHYNEWNRGKLSLGVELADPRGRQLLLDLAAQSDIFIENHRPGAKEKLGIGYEDVKSVRPDVIYLSLSGYGQTLPERDAMALGAPVELASGLFSLNGYLNDDTPAKTGFSYGDPVGALAALSALLMAVRTQRKTGEGQYLDIAMRDALAFGAGAAFTDWSANHEVRPRRGNRHPVYAPQGVYRTQGDDAWVAVSVRHDADWQALGLALGSPGWNADATYASAEGRRAHHDEIDAKIEEWTRQRSARDCEATLQQHGVPAGAVLDLQQVGEDPQLRARGAFQQIEHPAFGTEVRASSQWGRGADPQRIDLPAPCFGQHNHEVLSRIVGLDDDAISALERDGVIAGEINAGED